MSDTTGSAPAPAAAPASIESIESTAPEISAEAETDGEAEEAAPKTEAQKKEAAARKRKFSLKVNGKSRDIELDLDNDQEIEKYLQKAMAADEKFQEAAVTRKQAEQLVEMLRTNPKAILKHPDLGLDIQKLAHEIINEQIEDMSKTPEQKRLEEMEAKLKEYEEEKKRLENDKREAELAKLEQQAFQQLDDQIEQALSSSTLPKSPYVVKRITDAMIEAVGLGYTDVTAQQVMPYVEEQLTSEIQRLFEQAPDEVVEKLTGKDRLDKYRKARVAKAKAKPVETAKQVRDSGTKSEAKTKEEEKLTFKQMFGRF